VPTEAGKQIDRYIRLSAPDSLEGTVFEYRTDQRRRTADTCRPQGVVGVNQPGVIQEPTHLLGDSSASSLRNTTAFLSEPCRSFPSKAR
jgi:hypothetical protein